MHAPFGCNSNGDPDSPLGHDLLPFYSWKLKPENKAEIYDGLKKLIENFSGVLPSFQGLDISLWGPLSKDFHKS